MRLSLCVFLLQTSTNSAWSPGSLPNSEPIGSKHPTRRTFIATTTATVKALQLLVSAPTAAVAKCSDIESCREIGEKKDQEKERANPIVRLGQGLEYKVLRAGTSEQVVTEKSKVNIIYTISQGGGSYMYSRGFGYNKIDTGSGQKVVDVLDSLTVTIGEKTVPIGIQRAMIGMKRGERRRIEVPPQLGFETSNWEPNPTDYRGRQQVKDYQSRLYGRGNTQPPFPAPTIWDVEVISIR
jgi:hypothetical protein